MLDSSVCVNVLLATYNGGRFLREQLDSLCRQAGVRVSLYVTDDGSSDETIELLDDYSSRIAIHQIVKPKELPRGASASFLHLLRMADGDECDFYAFCDQDDIWLPEKLRRGTAKLLTSSADGYSCSAEAFWPDGKTRTLAQSPKIVDWDYYFEGAGQGCTFVFTKRLRDAVLGAIERAPREAQMAHYHDWLVYAVSRAEGLSWFFDSAIGIKYRQHGSNDTGARGSLSSMIRRVNLIRQLWYRGQVSAMIAFLTAAGLSDTSAVPALSGPANGGMLWRRFSLARQLLIRGRRKRSDRLVLACSAIFGFL